MKRKRGGQKGNQNARKHGFYSSSLNLTEICEACNLINLKGITPEIAVLRIKLHSLLQHDPGNHRVLGEASNLLSKLYGAKYRLTQEDTHQLNTFIKGILEQHPVPVPSQPDKPAKTDG
jgi:hypothetical protein